MKIEMIDTDKICILLNDEDMQNLDISFDEMDYSNIETRRVLWTLLDQARKELETNIDLSGRMLIEVVAIESGGCLMYFTILAPEPAARPRRLLMKKSSQISVFEFDNAELLLELSDGIKGFSAEFPKNELYFLDGKYRLIIYDMEPFSALPIILSEYCSGKTEGSMTASYTREYWEKVSKENALEELCCKSVN